MSKLMKDAKSFQSLRIINIFFNDAAHKREFKFKSQLLEEFWKKFHDHDEYPHYLDGAYQIDACCEVMAPSLQRKKSDESSNGNWTPMDFGKKSISHPTLLLLCSAFNEEIDTAFRNAITTNCGTAVLEASTFYVYKNIFHNPTIDFKDAISGEEKFFDVIVLFQISTHSFVKKMVDPENLFDDEILKEPTSSEGDISVLKFGLLFGQLEGFIVIRCHADSIESAISTIKGYFEEDGWFGNVKPITVFFCTPIKQELWGENNRFLASQYSLGESK